MTLRGQCLAYHPQSLVATTCGQAVGAPCTPQSRGAPCPSQTALAETKALVSLSTRYPQSTLLS